MLTQLADLEELRGELDDDEYEDTKTDTLQQLEEFKSSLARMAAGDVTLVNELESIRVSEAALFNDVHVLSFAKRKRKRGSDGRDWGNEKKRELRE